MTNNTERHNQLSIVSSIFKFSRPPMKSYHDGTGAALNSCPDCFRYTCLWTSGSLPIATTVNNINCNKIMLVRYVDNNNLKIKNLQTLYRWKGGCRPLHYYIAACIYCSDPNVLRHDVKVGRNQSSFWHSAIDICSSNSSTWKHSLPVHMGGRG